MIQLALTILIDLIWLFLQVFISIMSLQEGIPCLLYTSRCV